MKSEVTTKRVMALKTAQIKVNPDDGSMSHLLAIECVLEPGDLERIALMFKQRLPIDMTLTSPQSRMDLMVNVLREDASEQTAPLDPVTLDELRENAKVAVRTAANAEHLAENGDEHDREVADASEDIAANAITKAAEAAGMSEVEMSTALKAEIEQEILDEDERQADDQAAEEGAVAFAAEEGSTIEEIEAIEKEVLGHTIDESQPPAGDPEALQREIADHAAESEAAAGGDSTGAGAEVPAKPKRQRKARQAA